MNLARNVSYRAGNGAFYVVNPNVLNERLQLIVGFLNRTEGTVVAWLEAFNPRWYDVSVVSDDQIIEHAHVSPPPQQ